MQPGDLGWLIQRHAEIYRDEYGFDLSFEALVARIGADFVDRKDAVREACWIATDSGDESGTRRLGCVMLVRARDESSGRAKAGVAQLRLLLVEPQARGLGLGRQLVRQSSDFARQAGYKRIVLWTNRMLTSARAIYESEGYRLVTSRAHRSFGHKMIGETWSMDL